MLTIGRGYDWYRKYVYDKYTISNILFYDKDGIVVKSNEGWLEVINEGNIHVDLQYLYLDIDEIPLKRKIDFDYTGAFIISNGKHYDEIEADLYINVDLCGVKFKEYKREYDSIYKYYEGVDSTGQRFNLHENVKYLKKDLYSIYHNIEELAKKISTMYNYDNRELFEKDIEKLKKYGKQYFDEQDYVKNYSVEDYLKELNNNE